MPKDATTPVTPAAPSTPAPAVKPTKAVAPEKPSLMVTRPAKPKLTAKKALDLEASPRKMIEQETEKARTKIHRNTPTTEIAAAPAVPATAELEEVTEMPTGVETPASVPETPAPETPAAPRKIKIGDKEYTEEEIAAKLNEKSAPAPAAAATPAAPTAPQEEPAPEVTAEEIARRETEFVEATAAEIEAPLTEAEVDTILAGGADAVATLQSIRKRDMATAIMHARKGVAAGLNPVMEKIFAELKPLVENHQQLQRYTIEQQFLSKHKDFTPHLSTARAIAEELLHRYPQEVSKLSPDQFIDEVARQTDAVLTNEHKRWFPAGNGNWRASAQTPAPAPAVPPPSAPVAAPVAATPAPRPVRPPAPNAPIGSPGATPGFHKSVAHSLRG